MFDAIKSFFVFRHISTSVMFYSESSDVKDVRFLFRTPNTPTYDFLLYFLCTFTSGNGSQKTIDLKLI